MAPARDQTCTMKKPDGLLSGVRVQPALFVEDPFKLSQTFPVSKQSHLR